KVQKDLSILPQVPRLFISGDKAQISALIVNNTSSSKDVEVGFDMTNSNIIGDKNKIINVLANSSNLATFDVEIGTGELEKNISSDISFKATSGNLVDSIKLSKPIYPGKTSEYVFTNGSTNNLSYEEKVDFSKVSQNGGYLEVSLGATILTNLTKNLDKVLYFPRDDLSSKITFLKNALALQEIYKNLDKTSDFEDISLIDYNGNYHKVLEVIDLVKNDIKNYVQSDNGLSYFKDCSSWWLYDNCSDLNLTGDYLNLNITVDGVDNEEILSYYENTLINKIEDNKKYNIINTEIVDFLPIALYKDNDFVNKYFNPRKDLTNLEKLDYIKLYNLLGRDNLGIISTNINQYIKDLKNSVLVEARGSVLPSDNLYYYFSNDSVSTAKMIGVLIDSGVSEKLLTENLVRFLISNRDEIGNYYTYNFSEVISAINKYVEFSGELNGVNFEAKTYLNSKEIMTSTFKESNKFEIDKKTFNFGDYLISGENSLGFEKTGSGKLYYDIGVRYYLPVSEMSSREEGITVVRNYYNYDDYKGAYKKNCINPWWYYDFSGFGGYCIITKTKNIDSILKAKKGEYIIGEIEIVLDKERTNVVIQDYLPAGAEILNTNFNTTSSEVKDISGQNNNSWWQGGFDYVEQKDDRVYLFAKHLNAGTYKYTYVLQASHIGEYNLKPAVAELLDKPEIWGRSSGGKFEVK
ncbi:MAG: alpha-2-macroglobulin family protein, partial [Candidatus Gracilibacteria bacterium]|nr:alpha-2-macroglobulin family protein [Candidatus Gracilibacteria bacterium]